jgi:hypothetical protein
MSKFVLEIATDNAAFQDGDGDFELGRILREVAAKVEYGHNAAAVRDINGNAVGYFGKED